MKTRKSDLGQILLLILLGVAVILSLVIPHLSRQTREPRLLSISVLLRDTESSSWATARQGMEQAADELGAELRFLTLSSPNNSTEQSEIMRREASGGAEALILVPANPSALAQSLPACPVVTLESAMDGGAGTASPDNALLGQQLALALLEDWTEGGVLLLDVPGCTGVTTRLECAKEVLESAGVPVTLASTLPEEAIAESWVMAFDPTTTRQAADKNSTEAVPFSLYGVGSTTPIIVHLERGNISAIAAWSDYAAGYLAVRQAVAATQESEQALAPLPFSILRGEDIYDPENQKLLFPVTS